MVSRQLRHRREAFSDILPNAVLGCTASDASDHKFDGKPSSPDLPWHTVVSSRLGRDLLARQASISMIRGFIELSNRRGERELIVRQTATHHWAHRSCELLGINPVCIAKENDRRSNSSDRNWNVVASKYEGCRDQLSIALADRIDVTYVRPGGTIFKLLCDRLASDDGGHIQVLITKKNESTVKKLIDLGAVGYWMNLNLDAGNHSQTSDLEPLIDRKRVNDPEDIAMLSDHPENWLIHSTRKRTGPWPGQSQQQFEDWLLMTPPCHLRTTPIETLNQIIRQRRLVGSSCTVKSDDPVVSFTALPLVDWLKRRTFRSHLGRWDAEPYGLAIHHELAKQLDVSPVIYGDELTLKGLTQNDRWRFQSIGQTYDWREEKEWRVRGVLDLSKSSPTQVIVFIRDQSEVNRLSPCEWPIVTSDRFQ